MGPRKGPGENHKNGTYVPGNHALTKNKTAERCEANQMLYCTRDTNSRAT